jgi:hypothetical protein
MQKKQSVYDQIDLLLKNRYRLTRLPNERGEEIVKEASMQILSEASKKHIPALDSSKARQKKKKKKKKKNQQQQQLQQQQNKRMLQHLTM